MLIAIKAYIGRNPAVGKYLREIHSPRSLSTLRKDCIGSRYFSTKPAKKIVPPGSVEVQQFSTPASAGLTMVTNTKDNSSITDIEEIHEEAILNGFSSYEDPNTGFTVFTELFHLKRGTCCGNQCRHCPYGWESVPNNSRPGKVKSGDAAAVQKTMEDLEIRKKQQASGGSAKTSIKSATNRVGGSHGGRLTDKNVPYTKKGDQGTSQLLTGERRSKSDASFEAMGAVDELCSHAGLAHALLLEQQQQLQQPKNSTEIVDYGELADWLVQIMSRLFDAGSHIAKPAKVSDGADSDNSEASHGDKAFKADGVGGGMDIQHVEALEDWIDTMTETLPELRNFILPTGSVVAAQLHVCRTVCRRAERRTVPLVQDGVCDPKVLKYLNRLSDFFFTAARWCSFCHDAAEIEYRRPEKRDKQRVAKAREWKPNDKDNA
jgi:cob(I)alamin adenosyltransferase